MVEMQLISIRHDRVVVESALDVIVLCILLVEHSSADVGDVDTGVAFASDVELLALEAEGVDEVFPPFDELGCCFGVVLCCYVAG